MLLPNNQRQHRILHIQKDVLPYIQMRIAPGTWFHLISATLYDLIESD